MGDIFDFRLRQLSEHLVLTARKGNEWIEFEIEKDEDEPLGLEFEQPLLQDCTSCHNHCVFCFIDQLPAGLRPTLYFKDDDLRLSFLTGNYATLTNISDDELDRLIAYRFSPMNISVHTTHDQLRLKMMRHPQAGRIMDRLRRITEAGLSINAQLVLCPGINDGEELERTLTDLTGLGPPVQSIALVPVGITRYRQANGLYPLRPFTVAEAAAVIGAVEHWQRMMAGSRGTRLVYAADEFYLKAEKPLPDAGEYDDFPQLENGVGMAALTLRELEQGLERVDFEPEPAVYSVKPAEQYSPAQMDADPLFLLATGTAAEPLLKPYEERLSAFCGHRVMIKAVLNVFFGETITVAGLLTGQDLLQQLQPIIESNAPVRLILPSCMLKADEPVFLDDMTLQELADRLKAPIDVCQAGGWSLLGLLAWMSPDKGGSTHE
ncbi:MAG: DUF512 domain-containing protein [Clostridiaceae bacterium]|nr:DUF512 domain-containing protein [Clostridiaceae bacterium]